MRRRRWRQSRQSEFIDWRIRWQRFHWFVQQTRIAVIVIGSILTAAAVALGGLISFVGLIVPHMLRMVLGPDHVRLLPATALTGALFLLVADTVARTAIAPAELPVGVLTALIGGPFFLYLLRKTKQGVMS